METVYSCPLVALAPNAIAPASRTGAPLMLVVISGALAVSCIPNAEGGMDELLLDQPGQCLGGIELLIGEPARRLVRAVGKTQVLVMDNETMWKLVDRSPQFAQNILSTPAVRRHAASAQIKRRRERDAGQDRMEPVSNVEGMQDRSWFQDKLADLVIEARSTNKEVGLVLLDLGIVNSGQHDHDLSLSEIDATF